MCSKESLASAALTADDADPTDSHGYRAFTCACYRPLARVSSEQPLGKPHPSQFRTELTLHRFVGLSRSLIYRCDDQVLKHLDVPALDRLRVDLEVDQLLRTIH